MNTIGPRSGRGGKPVFTSPQVFARSPTSRLLLPSKPQRKKSLLCDESINWGSAFVFRVMEVPSDANKPPEADHSTTSFGYRLSIRRMQHGSYWFAQLLSSLIQSWAPITTSRHQTRKSMGGSAGQSFIILRRSQRWQFNQNIDRKEYWRPSHLATSISSNTLSLTWWGSELPWCKGKAQLRLCEGRACMYNWFRLFSTPAEIRSWA